MPAQGVIKSKAIKLRREGYSYSIISQKIGISQSTLSYWLRNIEYKPNKYVLKRIKEARIKAGKIRKKRRREEKAQIRKTAKKILSTLTNRELKIAGAALYWGDGRKHDGMVGLVNSDPRIIKFFIKWLNNICGIPRKNIRVEIHLYPDTNKEKVINLWNDITGIPKSQFLKTQIDRRKNKKLKKKGKLPFGTAHVYVRSGKDGKYGYRFYEQIKGWIEAIAEIT